MNLPFNVDPRNDNDNKNYNRNMDVRVRCCSLTKPAADGSLIGETVVRNYLESDDYKKSIDGKLTLGYLTHRGRALESMPDTIGNVGVLKKTVGKDDAGLNQRNQKTFFSASISKSL